MRGALTLAESVLSARLTFIITAPASSAERIGNRTLVASSAEAQRYVRLALSRIEGEL